MYKLYVTVEGDRSNNYQDMTCAVEAPIDISNTDMSELFNFKMLMINAYSVTFNRKISAEWEFEKQISNNLHDAAGNV